MTTNYNKQANKWSRDTPKHESDFSGTPEVLELARLYGRNKIILDLGCGEGYLARKMSSFARKVIGIDRSAEMIRFGKEKEYQQPRGIEYHVANVTDIPIDACSIDLCVGNHLTQYLKPGQLIPFYQEISRVLKPSGKFILQMAHPVLVLCTDFGDAARYKISNYDYIKSRGKFFRGTMKTVGGETFEVGLYHSTLTDHFKGISSADLKVTTLKEPVFPKRLARKYPIFRKLEGKTPVMIIVGEK